MLLNIRYELVNRCVLSFDLKLSIEVAARTDGGSLFQVNFPRRRDGTSIYSDISKCHQSLLRLEVVAPCESWEKLLIRVNMRWRVSAVCVE